MLSIGEFSKICKVSTKTLRYYDEIGLIKPSKINPENNYRYYSIEQLETMLFINRLKQYNFSLEEIRTIITSEEIPNEKLCLELYKKKKKLEKQIGQKKNILDNRPESDSIKIKYIPLFDAFALLTYFELMAIYFGQSDCPKRHSAAYLILV